MTGTLKILKKNKSKKTFLFSVTQYITVMEEYKKTKRLKITEKKANDFLISLGVHFLRNLPKPVNVGGQMFILKLIHESMNEICVWKHKISVSI